jgi:transposase
MNLRFDLSNPLRSQLLKRVYEAVQSMNYRLVRRIEIILDVLDGREMEGSAERYGVSTETVRLYIYEFILKQMASLVYKRPPGRPSKLTKSQRKELCQWIDEGPEKCGYDCGRWNTVLITDLIEKRFHKQYNLHYVADLLKNLGYSYQKARFVSDHLDDVSPKRAEWLSKTWPQTLKLAQEKQAMLLFGDEASFAQWGSLSYTWSKIGQQPLVKTSGSRKAYKVFGLIDYFTGTFFSKTLRQGKFNAASYQAFLLEVLDKTKGQLILIQDGARYHTSKAMTQFFADHADRLTRVDLPPYSPDFNPIEYLWRNLKSKATHLRYFPTFDHLVLKVDEKLAIYAQLPIDILGLMGKYCRSLGDDSSPLTALENLTT